MLKRMRYNKPNTIGKFKYNIKSKIHLFFMEDKTSSDRFSLVSPKIRSKSGITINT
jgi:hypothetical protein